MNGLLLLKVH